MFYIFPSYDYKLVIKQKIKKEETNKRYVFAPGAKHLGCIFEKFDQT